MEIKNTNRNEKIDESENYEVINPNLLKIIDKYQDKINSIANVINTTELIGYIFFFIFLLMLLIRLSPKINYNWLYLSLPSIICLVSFTILLNMYLILKNIIDEIENISTNENHQKKLSVGTSLSYYSLNLGSLCLGIYIILLCFKLDGFLLFKLNQIAMPLYILFGILILYFAFIFPAFVKRQLLFEIVMIGIYLTGLLIFLVSLNSKIDYRTENRFIYLFLIIIIPMILHIFYYIFMLITKKYNFLNNFMILTSILLLLSSLILIGLKLDNIISIETWIPMLIIVFSFCIAVSDKIFIFEDKIQSQG